MTTAIVNPALGSDFAGDDDFDADLSYASGRQALAENLARGLGTPRNGLWYAPGWGYDVRELVGSTRSDAEISSGIRQQCLTDERVLQIGVSVRRQGGALYIQLAITDAQGTFIRTVLADALTVELLDA